MPNKPFNPIAAKTRLRVNGALGRDKRKNERVGIPVIRPQ